MRFLAFSVPSPQDPEAFAARVFNALGVTHRARQSDAFGGRYFRSGDPRGEEMYLFCNREAGGALPFPEAAAGDWILRVDKTARTADEVREKLSSEARIDASLLRERER